MLTCCSHIVLAGDSSSYLRGDYTCTSKLNSWLPPSLPAACNKMPYITMEKLGETAAKRKRTSTCTQESMAWHEIAKQPPTEHELEEFYRNLSKASNRKPAILSLIPPYNSSFTSSSDQLPPLLQDLYEPDCLHLDYLQLLQRSKDACNSPVSEIQVRHLEELTRGQARNHHWFRYRTGRVTASFIRFSAFILHNYSHKLFIGRSHRSTSAITFFIAKSVLSRNPGF